MDVLEEVGLCTISHYMQVRRQTIATHAILPHYSICHLMEFSAAAAAAGSNPEVTEHDQQIGFVRSVRPTIVTHSCWRLITHMGMRWQHSTGYDQPTSHDILPQ